MANSKESYREDGKADALAGKPPRYEKRGSWQSLAYLESYDECAKEMAVAGSAITHPETKRESSNCGNPDCVGCSTTEPRVSVPAVNLATGVVGTLSMPKKTMDAIQRVARKRRLYRMADEGKAATDSESRVRALQSHLNNLRDSRLYCLDGKRSKRLDRAIARAHAKLDDAMDNHLINGYR